MKKLFLFIFSLIFTSHAHAEGDFFRPSCEGFYPIWETTGFVEPHRNMYIGTNGANFGIANKVQVGVQPVNFIYRTPNFYGKVLVFDQDHWHISTQIGTYYLLDQASRAFFSPMYSSRLNNSDFNVILLPVSVSATREISDWLQIHQTLTALTIRSSGEQLQTGTTFGYTVVAEMIAHTRHSVLFHAGEVGFWNHDLSLLGMSYRYHNTWLELRAGYFYRFHSGALQSAPLVGFGFSL